MGATAACEVAVHELGAGLWRLLARAILTASAAPGVEPGIANELTEYFNVKLASQITAASATTIVLQDLCLLVPCWQGKRCGRKVLLSCRDPR